MIICPTPWRQNKQDEVMQALHDERARLADEKDKIKGRGLYASTERQVIHILIGSLIFSIIIIFLIESSIK